MSTCWASASTGATTRRPWCPSRATGQPRGLDGPLDHGGWHPSIRHGVGHLLGARHDHAGATALLTRAPFMNPAVHVLVFEGFADWEPAYALAELRRSGGLDIVTLGFTDAPVRSMGGLRVVPDRAIAGL